MKITRIKIDKLSKRQTREQKPKAEEAVEAPSKPRTRKSKPKTESTSEN